MFHLIMKNVLEFSTMVFQIGLHRLIGLTIVCENLSVGYFHFLLVSCLVWKGLKPVYGCYLTWKMSPIFLKGRKHLFIQVNNIIMTLWFCKVAFLVPQEDDMFSLTLRNRFRHESVRGVSGNIPPHTPKSRLDERTKTYHVSTANYT